MKRKGLDERKNKNTQIQIKVGRAVIMYFGS
jgi:hypothetical protein